MTASTPPSDKVPPLVSPTADPTDPSAVGSGLTLSREEIATGTVWQESGRVRVRRVVTTRTETVEIQLRREELHIENVDAVAGRPTAGEPIGHPEHEPVVVVLREEVLAPPTVSVQAYEQVTVSVQRVSAEAVITTDVRHEEIDLNTTVLTDQDGDGPPAR